MPATPSPTANISIPLRSTPRPVKTLRAAPTAKWENIAIVKAVQAAVCPLNTRNGATAIGALDRKSTRLNSSHGYISYAVFCLKKKKKKKTLRHQHNVPLHSYLENVSTQE